jgi:hypothetical protein
MGLRLCCLFSLHSQLRRRILMQFVAWLAMHYFSTLSLKRYDFRGILLKVNCVFSLPYNFCQKHLSFYRVIKKSLCTWWLQLSQHTSFLLHYLAQSYCLAADRQGQGGTRLTLTPSVIPNSNYVIMVSDWNCLKYFCVIISVRRFSRKLLIIILLRFEGTFIFSTDFIWILGYQILWKSFQ